MRETDLNHIRTQIDRLDEQLLNLLVERLALARKAQACKQLAGLPPHSPERESEILQHLLRLARSNGIDGELIEAIYQPILTAGRSAGQNERSTP